jgi:hypothetical protein
MLLAGRPDYQGIDPTALDRLDRLPRLTQLATQLCYFAAVLPAAPGLSVAWAFDLGKRLGGHMASPARRNVLVVLLRRLEIEGLAHLVDIGEIPDEPA